MKKCLNIVLLLVVGLFVIKNDIVLAYNINIHYNGCKNLDSNLVRSYGNNESINTSKCNDDDFFGWEVMVYNNIKSEYARFCVDGVIYFDGISNYHCKQGAKIFNNGFSTSELKEAASYSDLYLEALTTANAPSFTAKFSSGTDKATGEMEEVQIFIGSKTKLPKNQFQLEGQVFVGWKAYTDNSKGKRVWMCEDGELIADCSNHGGLKIYADEAIVSQTGNPGDTVVFQAIWSSSSSIAPKVACDSIKDPKDCEDKECSWNKTHNFCNDTGLVYLSCGDADDIPEMVPVLVSFGVTALKTVAPIVLIIMSIIQLAKSITSGKEDEIKKAQTGLIKRIIAAVLVFFIIAIVQFIMLKVADSTEKDGLRKCLSCFLNGTGDCDALYYKDAEDNHIKIH